MSEHTFVLGKWGEATPWLSSNESLIRLNIDKVIYAEQPWFLSFNQYKHSPHCEKPLILEKELGNSLAHIDDLKTWLESGIRPHFNPSLTWTSKLRKIAYRAQKHKNGLDVNMLQGIVHMPQEVFTLYENRPDRKVIVLDIKSAYASIVRDLKMPDPAKLKYVDSRTVLSAWENDDVGGLFRVALTLKADAPAWFKELHPLMYVSNSASHPFKFTNDITIITWMHSLEREAWSPYLDIKPLDGIVAPLKAHPLAGIAATLLEQKTSNQDPLVDTQLKWLLSRIHSASVPKILRCSNPEQTTKWFRSIGSKPVIKHNQLPLSGGNWLLPDIHNVNIVYTWSATISGYMRAKWLNLLTILHKHTHDLQVCYANVDSLHVSIADSEWEHLHHTLVTQNVCGDNPGQWAVKTIGTQGLWLSTDKYWISSNSKLVKCTSLGENWKLKDSIFVIKSGKLKRMKRSLWSSLSSKKDTKLINRRLILQKRRTLLVLQDKSTSIKAWQKETLLSRNWKKKIWYKTRKSHGKEKPK